MSLQETEVIDRMKTSIKEAIQASKDLSVRSRLGGPYDRLRDNLVRIEGCCRQMALLYRDDATWLPFGMYMAECHKHAGGWLRGYFRHGVHVRLADGQINEMFLTLAMQLEAILKAVDIKTTARTGIIGSILPARPAEERRLGRPAFAQKPKKPVLIIPARYRAV